MNHYMILPSLTCQASCRYCFGPNSGKTTMDIAVFEAIADWIGKRDENRALEITFHGGEPLIAGTAFYKTALPLLKEHLPGKNVYLGIQSNLWLLDQEFCRLFKEYGISVGTSLDGPEIINDSQRGKGYFNKTMRGIELAREYGLNPGCICTFTALSMPYYKEIIDFFINNDLDISIHAAVLPANQKVDDGLSLNPEMYSELSLKILDYYIDNISRIKINTLDSMINSVPAKCGSICTLDECLGKHIAFGPDGEIYPCQRFAGIKEYSMGNVLDNHGEDKLSASTVWHSFDSRQKKVREYCGDCDFFESCKGGCPYNVISAYGNFDADMRDPYCTAYKRFFGTVLDKALVEIFSEENMDAVVKKPDEDKGLLRYGKLLSIMNGDPHPRDAAANAKRKNETHHSNDLIIPTNFA